jgi:hypothetical protein
MKRKMMMLARKMKTTIMISESCYRMRHAIASKEELT